MSQPLVESRPSTSSPLTGVCAVVPARGGSKGVPRKNVRPVAGEPLVARAVRTLREVPAIDAVVVSTDDTEIAEVARAAGATVVDRPESLAGDLASSESALLHVLDEMGDDAPGVTVFVQATSPFIRAADVERAIAWVRDGECDVAFSVVRSDVHLWRAGPDGPEGVNHDALVRQRRQDRAPEMAETGAFYVMRTSGFLEHRHRFFGRLRFVEVDPADALEIDSEHDLWLAGLQAAGRPDAAWRSPIPARAVVTDFDGVHTDDRVDVDQDGVESVRVNRSDGMGVSMLLRAGVPVLILSTETNAVVAARARKLGVEVVAGCADKRQALVAWARAQDLALADVAFLGNDVNDLTCLMSVGWPVVVADARPEALAAHPIVLRRRGGDGAVRELADRVLAGSTARPTRTSRGHDHA